MPRVLLHRHARTRGGVLLSLAALAVLVAGATGLARPAAAQPAPPPPPPTAPTSEFADLVARAGTADDHGGADQVVLFDRTESEVEPSGLAHVTQHVLTKALTVTGARDLAFQRFDYDPASQLIEIRRVRIHRADGTAVDVDPRAAVDVTQPMHMIYWGARMRCLNVPDLAAGDALEVQTYRKGFMIAYLGENGAADGAGRGAAAGELASGQAADDSRYIPPIRGHWYDVQLFAGRQPMLEKTVTVRLPLDKPLQYRIYNEPVFAETTRDQTHRTYRFWAEDCAPLPREWRAADAQDHGPKVVMATVDDWQTKSRWFWDVNQHQFDTTPEIDALVARITRGLKTDEQKVHALNHWAAMNIRYCGLNMGEGEGYVLHPGDMVLRERSGVCKDIAGMAITLCRAAGYEVYPAMTMAGSRVERIPADQFNHCVGAWKKPDGTWHLLDPTWIPFGRYDWSRSEGEQHFVIGTPWGEDLMQVRPYTPQENHAVLTIRAEVEPDGDVVGELHLTGDGEADSRLRRAMGQTQRPDILPDLRAWFGALAPGAQVSDLEAGDPLDWDEPMSVRCRFRLPGHVSVGERTCVWRPVALGLAHAGYAGAIRLASPPRLDEDRETPAMLWWPQTVIVDEELELPRGFAPALAQDRWQAGDPDAFAACDLQAEPDGRTLRTSGRFRFDRRQVPVDEWAAFRAAVHAWKDAADARLVALREGN